MTRVYNDAGQAIPVTVIAADGNVVLQTKKKESHGYSAIQVGFDDQKESRVNLPALGHFRKAGSTPRRFIREFRVNGDEEAENEIDLSVNQFQPGQFVDVIGVSKGKGFQGVVKRHGFSGQEASHGSKTHRRSGSVGAGSTPGRIWKNTGMPGRMGGERVTVQNLKVVQVREEEGVLLVSGAVPGARGGYLIIRPAIKKPAPEETKS